MSSPTKKGLLKHDRTHTGGKSPKLDVPKKGGAGGKGTWGKEGSEIEGAVAVRDAQDPNYDSEDDGYVPAGPPPLEVFKLGVKNLLDEYFVSGVVEEAQRALIELNHPELHHEFVKLTISKAMDLHDRERELASNLLPRLYPNVITHAKIVEGFTTLLERIEDLKLDIPSAPEYLSAFLARAVVDDLLPPAFLSPDSADVELAKETLVKAKSMIQGKGAFKRIAHVWGPGGDQSVKRFKERAQTILEEYLVNNDITETDNAIRELNVASFHWYVVKKAVLLALDSKDSDVDKIVKLLNTFSTSQLISEAHFIAGFDSCVEMIEDIELDTPRGRELLAQFVTRSINAGYLVPSYKAHYEQRLAALGTKKAAPQQTSEAPKAN
eukprot:Phypoly_transcript_09622.p1 GENE.Phypoly_transcript_09622~~Phypoly_transcript_09622.p1  ORF type:complete len:381 (+),score=81.49 Phypoly_transcript_09622:117-1259(+)